MKGLKISWYNSHLFLIETQIPVELFIFQKWHYTSYKAIKGNIWEGFILFISPSFELCYWRPFSCQSSLRISIKWREASSKMSLVVYMTYFWTKHNEFFRDFFRLPWHYMWKQSWNFFVNVEVTTESGS